MGALCTSSSESQINSRMNKWAKQEKEIIKLLLLGPGSTGKTTLFNCLQMAHNGGQLSIQDRQNHIANIQSNIIDGLYILIKQCNILYKKDKKLYKDCQMKKNDSLSKKVSIISDYHEAVDELRLKENELKQLASIISKLWNLECIQATFHYHNNNFAISDNLQYFFNNIDKIMNINYIPSEMDILQNRTRSNGMKEYEYKPTNETAKSFKVIDVGGQRMERRKWIKHFDNVRGVLFVASLIDYNCVLYEDSDVNSLVECVKVWSYVTGLKCFSKCGMILILNKDDLLQQLLCKKDNGLYQCFSESGVWETENDDEYWDPAIDEQYWPVINDSTQFEEYHLIVTKFIENLFINRNNNENKNQMFYTHVTVATDDKLVERVFNNVQDIVLQENLSRSGVWNYKSNNSDSSIDNENNNNHNNNKKNSNHLNINNISAQAMPVGNASAPSSMARDETDEHSVIPTE